jgi:FkbM family methyltransferase
MMFLLRRLISFLATHLPIGSASKEHLVDTVLLHLEEVAYSRLRNRGFQPGCVVDIGAHIGEWTKLTKAIFPETPFIMIEARNETRPYLQETAKSFSDVEFRIALLGPHEKAAAKFHALGTASSLYRERSDTPLEETTIPMTTLDNIIPDSCRPPFFLKLDVQGGELDVLRGGSATLDKSEVVQLEVALLPYNDGAPTSNNVINFMDERGFAIYDVASFIRPNRKDLVQIDIIFVRKDSSLRPTSFNFRAIQNGN